MTTHRPRHAWPARLPLAEIMLLLVAVCWGASYGLSKTALLYTTALSFIFIRFFATFLLLLPVLVRDFRQRKNQDWRIALPTGVVLLAIFISEVVGIRHTTASNAAVLISLCVLFTTLLDALVFRARINRVTASLALLSTLGVVLMSYRTMDTLTLNKGDILILQAAVLRGVMVVLTKSLTANKKVTMASLTAMQSLVVAAGALSLNLLANDGAIGIPTAVEFWLTSAFLVVFCTLFAFYAQNMAVQTLPAPKVAMLMGTEPLFGVLFAVLWLNESLSWIQLVGMLLIVLCVYAVSVQKAQASGLAPT